VARNDPTFGIDEDGHVEAKSSNAFGDLLNLSAAMYARIGWVEAEV
jgi:hypothetical protein